MGHVTHPFPSQVAHPSVLSVHTATVSKLRTTVTLDGWDVTVGPVELVVPLSNALNVVVLGVITTPGVLFCV